MVESDFVRTYNIINPLDIEWRKFYRLLSTIPIDASLFYNQFIEYGEDGTIQQKSDEPERGWWKKEFDRMRGRGDRQRVATSIDEMIQDQKNIGRE